MDVDEEQYDSSTLLYKECEKKGCKKYLDRVLEMTSFRITSKSKYIKQRRHVVGMTPTISYPLQCPFNPSSIYSYPPHVVHLNRPKKMKAPFRDTKTMLMSSFIFQLNTIEYHEKRKGVSSYDVENYLGLDEHGRRKNSKQIMSNMIAASAPCNIPQDVYDEKTRVHDLVLHGTASDGTSLAIHITNFVPWMYFHFDENVSLDEIRRKMSGILNTFPNVRYEISREESTAGFMPDKADPYSARKYNFVKVFNTDASSFSKNRLINEMKSLKAHVSEDMMMTPKVRYSAMTMQCPTEWYVVAKWKQCTSFTTVNQIEIEAHYEDIFPCLEAEGGAVMMSPLRRSFFDIEAHKDCDVQKDGGISNADLIENPIICINVAMFTEGWECEAQNEDAFLSDGKDDEIDFESNFIKSEMWQQRIPRMDDDDSFYDNLPRLSYDSFDLPDPLCVKKNEVIINAWCQTSKRMEEDGMTSIDSVAVIPPPEELKKLEKELRIASLIDREDAKDKLVSDGLGAFSHGDEDIMKLISGENDVETLPTIVTDDDVGSLDVDNEVYEENHIVKMVKENLDLFSNDGKHDFEKMTFPNPNNTGEMISSTMDHVSLGNMDDIDCEMIDSVSNLGAIGKMTLAELDEKKSNENANISASSNVLDKHENLRHVNDKDNIAVKDKIIGLTSDVREKRIDMENRSGFEFPSWCKTKLNAGCDVVKEYPEILTPVLLNGLRYIRRLCFFFDKDQKNDYECFIVPSLYQDQSIGIIVHSFKDAGSCLIAFRDWKIAMHADSSTGHFSHKYDVKTIITKVNLHLNDNIPIVNKSRDDPIDDETKMLEYLPVIERGYLSTKSSNIWTIIKNILIENGVLSDEEKDCDKIKRQCLKFFDNSILDLDSKNVNRSNGSNRNNNNNTSYKESFREYKYAADDALETSVFKSLYRFMDRYLFSPVHLERRISQSANTGINESIYQITSGQDEIDSYTAVSLAHPLLPSFSLKSLSSHFLNDNKMDIGIARMDECYKQRQFLPIIMYCDWDCILTCAVMVITNMFMGNASAARCAYLSPGDIVNYGQSKRIYSKNAVLSYRNRMVMVSNSVVCPLFFGGGFVATPVGGVYPCTTSCLDFRSFYVTIMMDHGACESGYMVIWDDNFNIISMVGKSSRELLIEYRKFVARMRKTYGDPERKIRPNARKYFQCKRCHCEDFSLLPLEYYLFDIDQTKNLLRANAIVRNQDDENLLNIIFKWLNDHCLKRSSSVSMDDSNDHSIDNISNTTLSHFDCRDLFSLNSSIKSNDSFAISNNLSTLMLKNLTSVCMRILPERLQLLPCHDDIYYWYKYFGEFRDESEAKTSFYYHGDVIYEKNERTIWIDRKVDLVNLSMGNDQSKHRDIHIHWLNQLKKVYYSDKSFSLSESFVFRTFDVNKDCSNCISKPWIMNMEKMHDESVVPDTTVSWDPYREERYAMDYDYLISRSSKLTSQTDPESVCLKDVVRYDRNDKSRSCRADLLTEHEEFYYVSAEEWALERLAPCEAVFREEMKKKLMHGKNSTQYDQYFDEAKATSEYCKLFGTPKKLETKKTAQTIKSWYVAKNTPFIPSTASFVLWRPGEFNNQARYEYIQRINDDVAKEIPQHFVEATFQYQDKAKNIMHSYMKKHNIESFSTDTFAEFCKKNEKFAADQRARHIIKGIPFDMSDYKYRERRGLMRYTNNAANVKQLYMTRNSIRKTQGQLMSDPIKYCKTSKKWLCPFAKRLYLALEQFQLKTKASANSVFGVNGMKGSNSFVAAFITYVSRNYIRFTTLVSLTRWFPPMEMWEKIIKIRKIAIEHKDSFSGILKAFNDRYIINAQFPLHPKAARQVWLKPVASIHEVSDTDNFQSMLSDDVVYGDTDSIMAANPGLIPANPMEPRSNAIDEERRKIGIEWGKSNADNVTKSFEMCGLRWMGIEFEKLFFPYILLHIVKKKYAGGHWTKTSVRDKITIRSFLQKRDIPKFLQSLAKPILDALINNLDIDSDTIDKLFLELFDKLISTKGRIDGDDDQQIKMFSKNQALKKEVYVNPSGQGEANARLKARFPGHEHLLGERVDYVVCMDNKAASSYKDKKNKRKISDWTYAVKHLQMLKEEEGQVPSIRIDVGYYLEKATTVVEEVYRVTKCPTPRYSFDSIHLSPHSSLSVHTQSIPSVERMIHPPKNSFKSLLYTARMYEDENGIIKSYESPEHYHADRVNCFELPLNDYIQSKHWNPMYIDPSKKKMVLSCLQKPLETLSGVTKHEKEMKTYFERLAFDFVKKSIEKAREIIKTDLLNEQIKAIKRSNMIESEELKMDDEKDHSKSKKRNTNQQSIMSMFLARGTR